MYVESYCCPFNGWLYSNPQLLSFQSLLEHNTNKSCESQVDDIVMLALQEAEIEPQQEAAEMKKLLEVEQAKNHQLRSLLENQQSKMAKLKKIYHEYMQKVENELFQSRSTNQKLSDEKKSLQKAHDTQMLVLSGQVEVYKKELESYKSDANYFERLLCERDRTREALRAELRKIQEKLCDMTK